MVCLKLRISLQNKHVLNVAAFVFLHWPLKSVKKLFEHSVHNKHAIVLLHMSKIFNFIFTEKL